MERIRFVDIIDLEEDNIGKIQYKIRINFYLFDFLNLKHVFMKHISLFPMQLKLKSNIIYVIIIIMLRRSMDNQL